MTGELIQTIEVKSEADDSGQETTTIRIVRTEDGFDVDHLVDGKITDCRSCDTLAEAKREAREWAIEVHRDYQDEARERRAEERRLRRDLVNDLAADFAGDDAKALRMVAALIGQGRAAQAVEVLRSVNKRREGK